MSTKNCSQPWWKRWLLSGRGSKQKAARTRLAVEPLEERDVPANSISGTVMQTLNVAGLFPQPSADFFGPVQGVTVRLDGGTPQTTGAGGTYTFTGVTPGSHTVSIDLPPGYLGFTAQSLSYTLNLADGADFANLNFALTPRNAAVVQNMYELVLGRPADFNGFNAQVAALDGGGTVGGVFRELFRSPEFMEVSRPVAGFLAAFFPGPLPIGPLRHSVELQNLGISADATVLDILYSEPFVSRFGDVSQLDNADYVRFLYRNLLDRSPSPQALDNNVRQLEAGTNRGELALKLVGGQAFEARQGIHRRVAVSLAYLGVLGREATLAEMQRWVRSGLTGPRVADQLASGPQFRALTGYTDTFFWDVLAHQTSPSVDVLSRLQIYNPATKSFDIAVTGDGVTSTAGSPKNVYFVAHGWSPGSLEPVLLGSTPGNPLKAWETADTDGAVPAWLYSGTDQVSAEGLAQAITDADPMAVVVAYSWLDLAATALSNDTIEVTATADTASGNPTLTGVDASRLGAGMTVTGPGIPPGTVVEFVTSQTSVRLSNPATATQSGVQLTFEGESVAEGVEQFLYAGQSESRTQWSGLLLAKAIEEALAPGFFPGLGLIHILGHSHGSKVATVATQALQLAGIPVSHLTLLESPEAGPTFNGTSLHASGLGNAENFNWYYLQQMNLSKTPVTGTRDPSGGVFVDNYYSQEGFGSAMSAFPGLGNVVDVLLHPEELYGSLSISDVQQDATVLFGSHDYPPAWYGQAGLQNPNGPANTLNGLHWSPLINPATTAALGSFYEQQPTAGQFVQTQFVLEPGTAPTAVTPTFTPLTYAQRSAVGQVTDDGSAITLAVDAASPRAIEAITFQPLGAAGAGGTGMDFQFTFTGVDPGEDVELVIWINGMASVPQDALTPPLGNTIGYLSIPLFTMDGLDAGTATQSGTISLDSERLGLIFGPFNSVVNPSSGNATPIVPTLGFSLLTSDGSTASVTVTNLRQFSDGIP